MTAANHWQTSQRSTWPSKCVSPGWMEAAQTRTWWDVSDRRLRDDALPPQLQRSFTGERASKIDVPSLWRHIQEDLKLSLLPKVHQPGVEQWPWGLVEEWILSLTFTELIPACTVYVHLYKYTCVYNKKLFIITCVASLWPVCHSVPPSSLFVPPVWICSTFFLPAVFRIALEEPDVFFSLCKVPGDTFGSDLAL